MDMKNGIPFEAETEYLYQKEIERLKDLLENANQTLFLGGDELTTELATLKKRAEVLVKALEGYATLSGTDGRDARLALREWRKP